MIGAGGTRDGARVEKVRANRGPKVRRYADPDAMADVLLGYLKGTGMPAAAVHDELAPLPRSLRSTERAMSRVRPIVPEDAA